MANVPGHVCHLTKHPDPRNQMLFLAFVLLSNITTPILHSHWCKEHCLWSLVKCTGNKKHTDEEEGEAQLPPGTAPWHQVWKGMGLCLGRSQQKEPSWSTYQVSVYIPVNLPKQCNIIPVDTPDFAVAGKKGRGAPALTCLAQGVTCHFYSGSFGHHWSREPSRISWKLQTAEEHMDMCEHSQSLPLLLMP